MSIRIAIATTDGKVVNEHFGRASVFYIIELDGEEYRFNEERPTAPVCGGGSHNDNDMENAACLLSDCQAVLVSKIGSGAKRALEIRGISVFEIGLPVDEALDKLRTYYYKRGKRI